MCRRKHLPHLGHGVVSFSFMLLCAWVTLFGLHVGLQGVFAVMAPPSLLWFAAGKHGKEDVAAVSVDVSAMPRLFTTGRALGFVAPWCRRVYTR